MIFEWYNIIKVFLFFDVGGLMDFYIKVCEELFLVVWIEFKYMDFFYFYNCLYEDVWKDNWCRYNEKSLMWDIFYKYLYDYKVIFVGDVIMSLYEIIYLGGLVEYWNEELGVIWL